MFVGWAIGAGKGTGDKHSLGAGSVYAQARTAARHTCAVTAKFWYWAVARRSARRILSLSMSEALAGGPRAQVHLPDAADLVLLSDPTGCSVWDVPRQHVLALAAGQMTRVAR